MGYIEVGKDTGRVNDHGLIGEGSKVIVEDLDGFGMESGGKAWGLEIFGHGSPAWGSFFTLAAKRLNGSGKASGL